MENTAAEQQPRTDSLSKRNFDRLARYINGYSGIRMPPSKGTMLEGRLRRRLRATGHASVNEYCNYLFDDGGIETEAVHLIDVATTNKTDFFREPNHFSYLCDVVLPTFVRRRQRTLRAWSSACSTGAEPYTLAMILEDFCRNNNISYSILATDLSTEVLSTAIRGVYPEDMVAPVPANMAKRYVMRPVRSDSHHVRIHPALRAKVGFARMNLMDAKYRVGDPMDLIFCRNVLIYFEKQTQAEVLKRLCDCLVPGGYMFIGHSESITGYTLPLKQVANTIFEKI